MSRAGYELFNNLYGLCFVIAKRELERSRLTKLWSSKRQMAKASGAYDANIMTETVAGN